MGQHSFSARCTAELAQCGGRCPIEGVLAKLADHACRHGRLPFDRTAACGCWAQEGAAVLALPRLRPARTPKGAPIHSTERSYSDCPNNRHPSCSSSSGSTRTAAAMLPGGIETKPGPNASGLGAAVPNHPDTRGGEPHA